MGLSSVDWAGLPRRATRLQSRVTGKARWCSNWLRVLARVSFPSMGSALSSLVARPSRPLALLLES